MKSGLVSVIIPIYKVEQFLPKCVRSIIEQSYANLEIILVDDGSPDGCPQICDDFAKTDSRIHVIHKKNGGLSSARNAGLDIANGEYILFVDSDDWIEPNMVSQLITKLIATNADIAVCDFKQVFEDGCACDKSPPAIGYLEDGVTEIEYWRHYPGNRAQLVVAWNKLYKKDLFTNVRYEIGKIHEDEYVLHKILSKSNRIVGVNAFLYNYLQRKNSIMGVLRQKPDFERMKFRARRLEYFLDRLKQDPKFYQALFDTILFYIEDIATQFWKISSKEENERRVYEECRKEFRNLCNRIPKSMIPAKLSVKIKLTNDCLFFYATFMLLRNKLQEFVKDNSLAQFVKNSSIYTALKKRYRSE